MKLSDFKQYWGKVPSRFGETSVYTKGEVRADTVEGREFQDSCAQSCWNSEVGKTLHNVTDLFKRPIKKTDIIILSCKAETKPVLFKLVDAKHCMVILQSLERPNFRYRAKCSSCIVITDQIKSNAEKAQLEKKHEIVRINGKYEMRELKEDDKRKS